jgi:hypothetical protein
LPHPRGRPPIRLGVVLRLGSLASRAHGAATSVARVRICTLDERRFPCFTHAERSTRTHQHVPPCTRAEPTAQRLPPGTTQHVNRVRFAAQLTLPLGRSRSRFHVVVRPSVTDLSPPSDPAHVCLISRDTGELNHLFALPLSDRVSEPISTFPTGACHEHQHVPLPGSRDACPENGRPRHRRARGGRLSSANVPVRRVFFLVSASSTVYSYSGVEIVVIPDAPSLQNRVDARVSVATLEPAPLATVRQRHIHVPLTKPSTRQKISSKVATISKQSSFCSSCLHPMPAVPLRLAAIALRTWRTSSWIFSFPNPVLSRFLVAPSSFPLKCRDTFAPQPVLL